MRQLQFLFLTPSGMPAAGSANLNAFPLFLFWRFFDPAIYGLAVESEDLGSE